MRFTVIKNTFFLLVLLLLACGNETAQTSVTLSTYPTTTKGITPGAEQPERYLPLLKGKKIGLVANQTSRLASKNMHLADFLLDKKIELVRVFAPEHGFRGTADAGEVVKDGVDVRSGLPIISLYGKNKKPTNKQLEGLDLIIFDIQDVGARFYTYISTLHYVMEACATNDIALVVLDRPNPNGHYIDGPVLKNGYQSFVGMHPVPVVHGMTVGEYAKMINGEGWLADGIQCALEVIPVANYRHGEKYSLPVRPSPNLPNDRSINLYPSLCFFEGTVISAGRGTQKQFQVFGAPELPSEEYPFLFTPAPNEGSKYPKFSGESCNGRDLSDHPHLSTLKLDWLIEAYEAYPDKAAFFIPFFDTLAGDSTLREQIKAGLSVMEIKESWKPGLERFRQTRKKYLIYD